MEIEIVSFYFPLQLFTALGCGNLCSGTIEEASCKVAENNSNGSSNVLAFEQSVACSTNERRIWTWSKI